MTTSLATIGAEIHQACEKIISGLEAIDKLSLSPDIAERVKSVFLRDFDLAAAIAEKDRIEAEREKLERYQAAQQAQAAEATPQGISAPVVEEAPTQPEQRPAVEENIYTVTFRINATKAQIDALGAFMKSINLKPERV